MKLMSIFGTRPQYVKVKPFYDRCRERGVEHLMIDTNQHFTKNVSQYFIDEFDLTIDEGLSIPNTNEIEFIGHAMIAVREMLVRRRPDAVVVYGDTNTTLLASLVAYKLRIPLAHVESGNRCGSLVVPEEANRIFSDLVSEYCFCPCPSAKETLGRGTVSGDLEYELLNLHYDHPVAFDDYAVMTLHRQENLTPERFAHIMQFCGRLPLPVNFHIHHRTKHFIEEQGIRLPGNIRLMEPIGYREFTEAMARCRFLVADSGGIQKTAPFFGKRCLVMRGEHEWPDTIREGFCRMDGDAEADAAWLMEKPPARRKDFYLVPGGGRWPSEVVLEALLARN